MSEFKIERIGEKGDGLSQGRAFPRSLVGETVSETGVLIKSSSDRITPICPVFETCGGCKLQHWHEEPYHAWKTALLEAALNAHGLNPKINPLIAAHGAGRRRVSFHIREVEGQWRAGFMAEASHRLVPIEACPILVPALQESPALAAKFGAFFGDCDVAITACDNGLDISIRASRKLVDKAVIQFDALMRSHNITRIAVNGETRAQLAPPVIIMGKAKVAIPVGTFLQATLMGEETLAKLINTNLKKSQRVADLFCGVGPFTFAMAERHTVHAVDAERPAIAALQLANRFTTGLKPITAEVRDLFRNPMTPMELNEFDAVVLDPPRAGAQAQCQNIAKSKVKRVIYVSCDVQTLARDAAMLCKSGYALESATPVDQFKYSAHLETVAVFRRI